MPNFKQLKADVISEIEKVVNEAEKSEPQIVDAVATALESAGVPAPLAEAAKNLLAGLLTQYVPPSPQPQPAAAPASTADEEWDGTEPAAAPAAQA